LRTEGNIVSADKEVVSNRSRSVSDLCDDCVQISRPFAASYDSCSDQKYGA